MSISMYVYRFNPIRITPAIIVFDLQNTIIIKEPFNVTCILMNTHEGTCNCIIRVFNTAVLNPLVRVFSFPFSVNIVQKTIETTNSVIYRICKVYILVQICFNSGICIEISRMHIYGCFSRTVFASAKKKYKQ